MRTLEGDEGKANENQALSTEEVGAAVPSGPALPGRPSNGRMGTSAPTPGHDCSCRGGLWPPALSVTASPCQLPQGGSQEHAFDTAPCLPPGRGKALSVLTQRLKVLRRSPHPPPSGAPSPRGRLCSLVRSLSFWGRLFSSSCQQLFHGLLQALHGEGEHGEDPGDGVVGLGPVVPPHGALTWVEPDHVGVAAFNALEPI